MLHGMKEIGVRIARDTHLHPSVYVAALKWGAVLLILFAGEPSLLDALVGIINRC